MKKIIITEKTIDEISIEDFFGTEMLPFVEGGVYYFDISSEGFRRPYIALPEKSELYRFDHIHVKKFVRVTSSQYSFFDLPIGTPGHTISFAATHEIVGIKFTEFRRKVTGINVPNAIEWASPQWRIHPLILDLIVRTVHRDDITDPEEYAELIDRIYRYNKHIETFGLPTYTKIHNVSKSNPSYEKQGNRFQFNFDLPEMLTYTLSTVPENEEDSSNQEVLCAASATRNSKPINNPRKTSASSTGNSFAEKVQAAYNSSQKEDSDYQTVYSTEFPEDEENPVEDIPSTPQEESEPSTPESDLELISKLPKSGVLIADMTLEQMRAFATAYQTCDRQFLLSEMGYSAKSKNALDRRYKMIKARLEASENNAESLGESEPSTPESDLELQDCIDLEEINRYLSPQGHPKIGGKPDKFNLGKMREFILMDKRNDAFLFNKFNLNSKTQLIRLRGLILNEFDARNENKHMINIPHRLDYFNIDVVNENRTDYNISDVGAMALLTDVAKFSEQKVKSAYQLTDANFKVLLERCLEVYHRLHHS